MKYLLIVVNNNITYFGSASFRRPADLTAVVEIPPSVDENEDLLMANELQLSKAGLSRRHSSAVVPGLHYGRRGTIFQPHKPKFETARTRRQSVAVAPPNWPLARERTERPSGD